MSNIIEISKINVGQSPDFGRANNFDVFPEPGVGCDLFLIFLDQLRVDGRHGHEHGRPFAGRHVHAQQIGPDGRSVEPRQHYAPVDKQTT